MQIECAGITTNYQQIGQGTPMVLLHGWGGNWESWYPVISALSDKYQLVIPDLPAFGKSTEPTKVWNSADYVDWLSEFVTKAVGKKKYFLVGHSFGGKIAALFAAAAAQGSHLPTHLFIVDASGLPDPLTTPQHLQQTFLKMIPDPLKNAVSHSLKQQLLKLLHSSSDHLESTSYQRQVLRLIVRENIAEQLKKISVPTTLIWGELDDATPLAQGQQFEKNISGAKLHVISGVGHFPFIEQTGTFLSIINSILERK